VTVDSGAVAELTLEVDVRGELLAPDVQDEDGRPVLLVGKGYLDGSVEASRAQKEKRQPYSAGIPELWPGRDPKGLFILDKTIYRRIVWQGGGGYLAVHDLLWSRWAFSGP
jgi:hypothetical protein